MNLQRLLNTSTEPARQYHDELSGLYNLGLFHIAMDQEIKRCERQWDSFAVCLIDIDGLGAINESKGREAGDAVIREVGSMISKNIREVDLPFRCFDDVFGILLIRTEADLAQIAAERIRRAINNRLGGRPTVSLGLASFPRDATSKTELLAKAKEALEHAKSIGKDASYFFEYERPFDDDEKPHVLIVDDDERNAKLIEAYLMPLNCNISKASRGAEALDMVRSQEFDVILLDIMMPEMNGYEVCRRLKSVEKTRLIPIILVTALDDAESKVKGIEIGADDFITKPVNREELIARTKSLIKVKRLNRNLMSTENVLFSLANAVEAKDSYTQGHTRRVSMMAVSLGRKMGLSQRNVEALNVGGILHDVGKIGISIEILNKNGKLTDDEWEEMKSHPDLGYNICMPLESTLGAALDAVKHHHEKLDGSGYPDKLKDDQITIVARIMAVVDIYDALVTNRPYREAMDQEQALSILREEAENGKIDKNVVENLIAIVNQPLSHAPQNADMNSNPVVLVIEDNELNMKLVKTLMELESYEILSAADAETGLEMLKTRRPDVILMDIQLPGLDGLSATKIIKDDPELKSIPVVALTSYAMQTDKQKAEEAGCDGFISKPIDTKSFIPTINRFLHKQ